MAEFKKVTINMTTGLYDDIAQMASERGITLTELIRRALAVEKFVWENRDSTLLLKDGTRLREIVIL